MIRVFFGIFRNVELSSLLTSLSSRVCCSPRQIEESFLQQFHGYRVQQQIWDIILALLTHWSERCGDDTSTEEIWKNRPKLSQGKALLLLLQPWLPLLFLTARRRPPSRRSSPRHPRQIVVISAISVKRLSQNRE